MSQYVVKQSLGRAMVYYDLDSTKLRSQTALAFEEIKSYKKPETLFTTNRFLQSPPPGKVRAKYWEDVKRHYDQRQAGFFVCQVLAKRKIAIPLR